MYVLWLFDPRLPCLYPVGMAGLFVFALLVREKSAASRLLFSLVTCSSFCVLVSLPSIFLSFPPAAAAQHWYAHCVCVCLSVCLSLCLCVQLTECSTTRVPSLRLVIDPVCLPGLDVSRGRVLVPPTYKDITLVCLFL